MADAGDGRAEFDLVIQSEQIHAGFGGIDQVGNREMGRNRNRNKGKKTKEEKGRGQNDLRLNSATRSTYNVSAISTVTEAIGAASPQITASVKVDLNAVIVGDALTIYDADLPVTVTLSGTVFNHANVPLAPARVVATVADAEAAVPSDIDLSCRPQVTFSLVPIPVSGTAFVHPAADGGNPTGAYRMPLPDGTYRLGVTLGLELQPGATPTLADLNTSPHAILYMAAPGPDVALSTDVARDLSVPALPPVVMVSGQVTDALGQPVADAAIKAMTSTLVDVSNAVRFLAVAQTQADGTYTLPVLSGTSYAVMACPPSANPAVNTAIPVRG